LDDALALAAAGGFIRAFVDEGPLMAGLLSEAAANGIMPHYTGQLLAVLEGEKPKGGDPSNPSLDRSLVEPLSKRELQILQLIARGYSNHEITEQLYLALSTVKGHNRNIFGKLQV